MGWKGGGKREIIYPSLHCHHQNDSCIKMGSDVSHFNVSLIVRNKVTRFPQTTTFEEKGGPSAYQPNALALGQTGSRLKTISLCAVEFITIGGVPWPNGFCNHSVKAITVTSEDINPWTAMLATVTGKTTSKSVNFEIIMAFPLLRVNTCKEFYQNTQY